MFSLHANLNQASVVFSGVARIVGLNLISVISNRRLLRGIGLRLHKIDQGSDVQNIHTCKPWRIEVTQIYAALHNKHSTETTIPIYLKVLCSGTQPIIRSREIYRIHELEFSIHSVAA
jgi:hypothetical protein